MKLLIVKAGTTMPELNALINEHVKLELNQSLTAVDIYVGDDHLRIACRIDAVDQIMEDVVKMINIPGESVMCHEAIELDSSFVDYTKWPLILNKGKLRDTLMEAFGLVRMFECRAENCYIKTTGYGLASEFASIHECTINKYLTRL
jgi:hypothetical protein